MSLKNSLGFLAAGAILTLIAQGCSSSPSAPADSGIPEHKDTGAVLPMDAGDDGGDAGSLCGGPADGTTGNLCTTDADCSVKGGPGINRCSNDFAFPLFAGTKVETQFYATPVCMLPPTSPNCDPAPPSDPTGQLIHFCDGPDDPSSPGICIPGTSTPVSCEGTCYPACSFQFDGSAPTGCKGKNVCYPAYIGFDQSGNPSGLGYCVSACQSDADCSPLKTADGGTYVCQEDVGQCVTAHIVRKKQVGAACSANPAQTTGNDSYTGACNCVSDTNTFAGYCTTACVVGGDPCPNGSICDNLEQNSIQLQDGSLFNVPAENPQTPGVCIPACSLDGGVVASAAPDSGTTPSEASTPDAGTSTEGGSTADGGSPVEAGSAVDAAAEAGTTVPQSCPGSSTCQVVSPVGPDCVP